MFHTLIAQLVCAFTGRRAWGFVASKRTATATPSFRCTGWRYVGRATAFRSYRSQKCCSHIRLRGSWRFRGIISRRFC